MGRPSMMSAGAVVASTPRESSCSTARSRSGERGPEWGHDKFAEGLLNAVDAQHLDDMDQQGSSNAFARFKVCYVTWVA